MRVFITYLVLIIAVSFLLTGCSGQVKPTQTIPPTTSGSPAISPEPAKAVGPVTPYGTIRVAISDFGDESMEQGSTWGWAMYDNLITVDAAGNYIGSVAKSWSIGEDRNTWTFKIRDDIIFHNGDRLTAYDVKFSVDRFASPESTNAWSPYLRMNLNSTEVLDDYTFAYKTNTPELPLVACFAATPIISKNYFEKVGKEEFLKHPVGSGPWKFAELISETSLKLEAFTGHWRQVPAFQYVIEYQIPEEATRVASLKKGEVDIATGIASDSIVPMMKEGWRMEVFGLPSILTISFPGTWMTHGPTSDIRIRKAISYAINRQELCDTLFRGMARPGGRWFMHEATWGWDPIWAPDPYNPELARRLLSEAGYPGAFSTPTINLFIATGSPTMEVAQVLQNYWANVGIDIKIEFRELSVYFAMFMIRQTDPNSPAIGGIFPWILPSVFDNFYHCANIYTSTGVHTTANDLKVDQLYHKVMQTIDDAERKRLWTEFQNYAKEMWVNVGIATIDAPVVMGPNLGKVTTNRHIYLTDAYAGIQHP
jgi:peptide/nickel transport system substrate-binding protein